MASQVITVSQLSSLIKEVMEGSFGIVQVQGEISGGKLAASGHYYADLRDEGATLACVAWKGNVASWPAIPQNGDNVILTGELTTYPGRSIYQLKIIRAEKAGQGALLQQIEKLKQTLLAEGLLDTARKKQRPWLPTRIGIITSPKGAVIQDILHRLEERCPLPVILWPTAVQGPAAAAEIAAAIHGMNTLPSSQRPDLLIIARGGGSFEDLLPFNSEAVARAVAASAIPTISGVGHEPDITLCDLVADFRAPTPTAAAEMAVPVRAEVLAALAGTASQLTRTITQRAEGQQQKLGYLARLLPSPQNRILQASQRLDDASSRLTALTPHLLAPAQNRLVTLTRLLATLNPRAPLENGYAMVHDTAGKLVTSAHHPAGGISLTFRDGTRKGMLD